MDAKKDLLFVLLILFVLGIAWFVSGGPERAGTTLPFLNPPPPLGTGGTYGTPGANFWWPFQETIGGSGGGNAKETGGGAMSDTSSRQGKVELRNAYGAEANKPSEEYVTLETRGNAPIDITGWKLRSSVTGGGASIGKGAKLAYSAQINIEGNVMLESGDRAIVVTGRSPVGVSFLVNKCSGYFEQFQNFTPSLYTLCPRPADELNDFGPRNLPDVCIDYLERTQNCQMILSPPTDLPPVCNSFITENINYNSCVQNHKGDDDFYGYPGNGREWRIFLNRDQELWKQKREIIELIDKSGVVVDSFSY